MIVYVCGPLTMGGRETSREQMNERIETAELVAAALMSANHSPITTHPICRHGQAIKTIPQSVAMDACVELVRRADGLVVIDGFESSDGSMEEVRVARRRSMPFLSPDLKRHPFPVPWTRADAIKILGWKET